MSHRTWSRRQFITTLGGTALLASRAARAADAAAPVRPARRSVSRPADLPRRDGRPIESHPGLVTEAGTLVTKDGTRLRTVLTRPADARGRLPAILFVQWLSCDTIELAAEAN
jgi:predicted acyl esterase